MRILVIDIGGTNVKMMVTGRDNVRKFRSGKRLTAKRMVEKVLAATADWKFDAVSIGIPGPVADDMPAVEPANLGPGWVDFDFATAFDKPVKVANDAALQALGSYEGGRMLFLGLGTALGSTLIVDGKVVPLELGRLKHTARENYADYLGDAGLARRGLIKWRQAVDEIVELLSAVFLTDYIVIGGGNVKLLKRLPEGVIRGHNRNAFRGGERLWENPPYISDAGRSAAKVT